MKHLILIFSALMLLASFAMRWYLPNAQGDKPTIFWVTDANPARTDQVRLFEQWIESNHYPDMRLRIDANNGDFAKKIIHGVSGVGGDVMDMFSGADLQFFHAMGLMSDVTEDALRLGFDPSHTYPSLAAEITLPTRDGPAKQFMFPCNASTELYFVNADTFERYGQPVPPAQWTTDEFEQMGRAFVAAANHSSTQRVFYADRVDLNVLRRSMGIDRYNETMTRCTLDDPRAIAALERLRQWMYVDRLIPSAADRDAFSTATGYGGQSPRLFAEGTYAMLLSGRHLFIQWREINKSRIHQNGKPLTIKLAEPPNDGFRNVHIMTRAAMVYAGSAHRELAVYFLAFLASREYNMQIVHDADALPPNPAYTRVPEFNQPTTDAQRGIYAETESGNHAPFSEAASTIAIGASHSVFVLSAISTREETLANEGYLADPPLWDAVTAAQRATNRVNYEIERTLHENPAMRKRYDELVERQKLIDQYKATGRKLPAEWIENPFHKAYYRHMGLLDENPPAEAPHDRGTR